MYQAGSAKYSVKFSDLVKDILGKGIHKYFTRNLGSNTSTIKSYTELGMPTQNLCTNIQGVQFTIKVSEYGCVGWNDNNINKTLSNKIEFYF